MAKCIFTGNLNLKKIHWKLKGTNKRNEFGPLVLPTPLQKKPTVLKTGWHLDLGPRNVRCEFEKDPLETKGFWTMQNKNAGGSLDATNVTNVEQKYIRV